MQIDQLILPPGASALRSAPPGPNAANPAQAQPSPGPAGSAAGLREAVKAANDAVRSLSGSVEFSIDEQSGRTIVRIVDAGTGELIRQLPSEEMLALSKALDRLQGLLIEDRA